MNPYVSTTTGTPIGAIEEDSEYLNGMEIVEDNLSVELATFLDRPLFCHLAQFSNDGPRVSPLWFLWEDNAIWTIAQLRDRSYPDRVKRDSRTAIAIIDFDPTIGRVEHVGMRGQASIEAFGEPRANRLLIKYLGTEQGEWPDRFTLLDPDSYRLIRFEPQTVVARDQSYSVPSGIPD